jgi:hypothetical protein
MATTMTKEEISQQILDLKKQITAIRGHDKGVITLVAVHVGDKRVPFMEDVYAQAYIKCFKKHDTDNTPVSVSMIETDEYSDLYEAALDNTQLWYGEI